MPRLCSPPSRATSRATPSSSAQRMKRGEIIMAQLAAANCDPAAFDHPDELRLERFPNPHLVFSSGIHFCLGMQLARLEAQSALTRLYARFPDLAWPRRTGSTGSSGLASAARRRCGCGCAPARSGWRRSRYSSSARLDPARIAASTPSARSR